jgi:hypothetical protein
VKGPASLFSIALALGATIIVPKAGAQVTQINSCRDIPDPGSYVLVRNLTNVPSRDICLRISSDESVTIDLAGFSISSNTSTGTGIRAFGRGKVVRNGSISGFSDGVDFYFTTGSVVERLQVFGNSHDGITANGIVRDNVVVENGIDGINTPVDTSTVTGNYLSGNGTAIFADGLISGNTVQGPGRGIRALTGSTVIGNDVRLASFGISAIAL